MTVRKCLPWPDRKLREIASSEMPKWNEICLIWTDMVDTMEAMPGVGLAAPQIGVMLRLAVVDASETRGQAIRMANPEIITASERMDTATEASPNLPGVSAQITRPAEVTVAYTDHHGMRVRSDFTGLWARSVQHQIDHLNGRMFFDNLSKVKRDMLLRKARRKVN